MIPFVFSVAPSVVTVDGHGFVVDAVVEAVTELQRLELRPVKVRPVILPVPSSEFSKLICTVEKVAVTVLITEPSLALTVRMTKPTLTA
jgi:hypothetical protein